MEYKIVYTADIHGNLIQYKKLVDYSLKSKAKAVIIGGDIAPKGFSKDYIKKQRDFLEKELPGLISRLKESDINLFLMMGNDDCKSNMGILKRLEKENYLLLINEKRTKLTEDFDIVGYPYVPVTPFEIKDWEKYDLSDVPAGLIVEYNNMKISGFRFEGIKSTKNGWEKFLFNPLIEKKDSIQKDLSSKLFTENSDKTLYVFHTPPYKTNLDKTKWNNVGSMALRLFIEKNHPYLTLHGHIHETVNISGNFKDKIGKTLCMSPGNSNRERKLSLLEFDLYKIKDAKRIII
jgi:Icc-related predicted phosphoesterase